MGGDAPAGPSLLQAPADIVSSRHLNHKQHLHNHRHNQYRRSHLDLRRRQTDFLATDVTTTLQVVQEVIVDISGSTIQVQTVQEDSSTSTTWTTTPSGSSASESSLTPAPTLPSSTEIPIPTDITPEYWPSSKPPPYPQSLYPQSLPTSQPAFPTSQSLTSAPSFSQQNLPIVVNSTSSALGTTSQSRSNYTLSSTVSSTISSSTISSSSSTTTTTSCATDSSTTSLFSSTDLSTSSEPVETPANTLVGGGGIGSIPSTSATNPQTSSGPGGAGNSGSPTSSPTSVLVGGIVGGVAGFALILMLLIFLLRWKKRNPGAFFLGRSKDSNTAPVATRGPGLLQPGPMAERSVPFSIPSSLASLTGYKKVSHEHSSSKSPSASERGFYRVSGRKLRSVLQSGGDGWDGPDDNTLSGSSFYRDSYGFYGGPGGSPSPLGRPSHDRESGIPIMRPSPARTPVTSQGPFARPPSSPRVEPPRRPDVLGRSHPSQDGSHGSKFHEDV